MKTAARKLGAFGRSESYSGRCLRRFWRRRARQAASSSSAMYTVRRETRRAPIDANAVPQEDFQNMKLGRHFFLSLRTILVRYDFDDNTSIDSSAEGECFAKGSDNGLMSNSFPAIACPCKNVNHMQPLFTIRLAFPSPPFSLSPPSSSHLSSLLIALSPRLLHPTQARNAKSHYSTVLPQNEIFHPQKKYCNTPAGLPSHWWIPTHTDTAPHDLSIPSRRSGVQTFARSP